MVEIPPEVIAAAQAAQGAWRVPASISLAQWALESGWGAHMPPGSNNPFGIKARAGDPSVTSQTREVVNGQSVEIEAAFRAFASIDAAFGYHAQLLATSPEYAYAMFHTDDPEAFADCLTGVYATDPAYGSTLKEIMAGRNLYQYDAYPVST